MGRKQKSEVPSDIKHPRLVKILKIFEVMQDTNFSPISQEKGAKFNVPICKFIVLS